MTSATRHLALVPDLATTTTSESTSTGHIPFARAEGTSDTLWSSFLSDFVGQKDVQGEIKRLVEARIADVVARARTVEVFSRDNPFDAVYLSELAADALLPQYASKLNKYAAMEDLSDQLQIKDQWED